jgi:hypothetical protein
MTIRREDAPQDPMVQKQGNDKQEHDQLTSRPDYVGENERKGIVKGGSMLQPLDLKSGKIHRASGLSAFRDQYEIYKIPVHHTDRSLARVNDLRDAGAPRTPAEIDPATAKRFRELSTTGGNNTQQGNADQWIEQEGELEADFNSYMAAREAVKGVTDQFRAAMEILKRRQLQAAKAGKQSEKDKIDQMAQTCTRIVHTAIMATNLMTTIEGGFLASSAAGDDYTETVIRNDETGKDEIGHKVSRTTAAQKAFKLAKDASGALSLENVFIAVTGNSQKYQQLIKDIIELEKQIGESELKGEDLQISSAREALKNIKVQVNDKRGAFSDKRQHARYAAQTFGDGMKAGKKGIAATLMAQAYMELDMFSDRALDEANQIQKPAHQVLTWLANHSEMIKAHRLDELDDFANDAAAVHRAASNTVLTHRTLSTEVPIWQQTATSWKHFLTDVIGKKFDPSDVGPESEPARYHEKK